jgi:hypothetical protein
MQVARLALCYGESINLNDFAGGENKKSMRVMPLCLWGI